MKIHQIIGLPGAPKSLALALVTCLGNICILCIRDIPSISVQCVVGSVICAKGVAVLPNSSHSVIVPTERMVIVIIHISYWKQKTVSLLKSEDHVPQPWTTNAKFWFWIFQLLCFQNISKAKNPAPNANRISPILTSSCMQLWLLLSFANIWIWHIFKAFVTYPCVIT